VPRQTPGGDSGPYAIVFKAVMETRRDLKKDARKKQKSTKEYLGYS